MPVRQFAGATNRTVGSSIDCCQEERLPVAETELVGNLSSWNGRQRITCGIRGSWAYETTKQRGMSGGRGEIPVLTLWTGRQTLAGNTPHVPVI